MSNSGTAECQSYAEKYFRRPQFFVGLSGLRQDLVYMVSVVILGQSNVMELDDIGSVRLVQ